MAIRGLGWRFLSRDITFQLLPVMALMAVAGLRSYWGEGKARAVLALFSTPPWAFFSARPVNLTLAT